jgi:hypothetical protein
MANQMWRAVTAFRIITLAYAAALIVRDHGQYRHPAGGLLALGVMVCWTLATALAYARPAGRA